MVDYLWFVEFQKRGAPHIHILLDLNQFQADQNRADLARYWSELVEPEDWQYSRLFINKPFYRLDRSILPGRTTRSAVESVHRHPRQWEGARVKEGAARYAVKYAAKSEQKDVPKAFNDMGRFWGAPRQMSLKNLVKTWVYTDEEGAIEMCKMMGRDFSGYEYLPKVIYGNTDEICKVLGDSV